MIRLARLQMGDYLEAYEKFKNGGEENYRGQFYVLQTLDQTIDHGLIINLQQQNQQDYDTQIDKYRLIQSSWLPKSRGFQFWIDAFAQGNKLKKLISEYKPTHLLVECPSLVTIPVIRWALRNGVKVLPIYADDFSAMKGPSGKLQNYLLRRELNRKEISYVHNHNISACKSLKEIGVHENKIIPWDWPPRSHPEKNSPKKSPKSNLPLKFIYAGMMTITKGVLDALEAVKQLNCTGITSELHIFGDGDLRKQIDNDVNNGLYGSKIVVHGKVPNRVVNEAMRNSDFVLVPSHAAFPEGLPNVIYESFENRIPLIATKHPMFIERLKSGRGCKLINERSPSEIVTVVKEILTTTGEYEKLSETTLEAWQAIQCPLKWGDAVINFLHT
jgi:glycosyltransferase involved in cell wall biosynthesis